jgi:hypothetical protein
MCDFASFLISKDGKKYACADLQSHSATMKALKLSEKDWRECEWTEDDTGDSLFVRRYDPDPDESWYRACILGDYKTRQELLDYLIPIVAENSGNLNLYKCTGLKSLPKNLKVGGYLDLARCTGLKALPQNLEVSDYLDLYNCTGLKSLPENLKVSGNLYLIGCTGLQVLPENLEVGGELYLGGTSLAGKYTTKNGKVVRI